MVLFVFNPGIKSETHSGFLQHSGRTERTPFLQHIFTVNKIMNIMKITFFFFFFSPKGNFFDGIVCISL